MRALAAVGAAIALIAAAAAQAGPPGSTVMVSRPTGFGPLTPPVVNDSAVSTFGSFSLVSPGSTLPGAHVVGGPGGTPRYVAFLSRADGLLPDDNDTVVNAYVRDLQTGTVTLVSRATNGEPADDDTVAVALSADGTTAAFESAAGNLAVNVAAGTDRVYKRNLTTGTTSLVSRATNNEVADAGAFEPSISGDGSAVAFTSPASNLGGGNGAHYQVYVREGTTTTVVSVADQTTTPGNDDSYGPSLSDDGNQVAFATDATNLGVADGNGSSDVFRHTISDGHTLPASIRTIPVAGALGDGASSGASISADGHRVAFVTSSQNLSTADNLPQATNDAYVHDFGADSTFLVSVTGGGTRENSPAQRASISADGTRIAFQTQADNLDAGDTNDVTDVYVRDTSASTTTRASRCVGGGLLSSGGGEPSMAPAGTHVAFATTTPGCSPGQDDEYQQVFLRALSGSGEATTWVSHPAGDGAFRSGTIASVLNSIDARDSDTTSVISADGNVTAFASASDEMSAADDNRFSNVFVRVGTTGATELISRAGGADGAPGDNHSGPVIHSPFFGDNQIAQGPSKPSISADGRYVAFSSLADNLVPGDTNNRLDVFVRDRLTQTMTRVSLAVDGSQATGASSSPDISADGNRIAFVSSARLDPVHDPDTLPDVYVRDIAAGTTTLASVNGAGVHADHPSNKAAISGDGTRVVFVTAATNLVPALDDSNGLDDAYLRDLAAGTTRVASATNNTPVAGNGRVEDADIDQTGAHVVFTSDADNLIANDSNGNSDVFVRDTFGGKTVLASATATGAPGDSDSRGGSISADGTRVAFSTGATDLFPADTNGVSDVVVRDLTAGTTTLASRADGASGAQGNQIAAGASISGDGHCVAFQTRADNLVAGPAGTDFSHAFLRALDGDCGTPPSDNPPPPPPPPTTTPDTTAPVITGLKVSPATFRVSARRTAISARKRVPKGTRIRFTLSEAVKVALKIERKGKGRKKGSKCLAKRRTGKRCTLYKAKGTLRRNGKAGANSVAFSGRIGARKLAKGRYRITLTATDAAGNKAKRRTVSFRVV